MTETKDYLGDDIQTLTVCRSLVRADVDVRAPSGRGGCLDVSMVIDSSILWLVLVECMRHEPMNSCAVLTFTVD